MQIKSEPATRTYDVLDVDFTMAGDTRYSITFPVPAAGEPNPLQQTDDEFTIRLNNETVHVLKRHVMWWSERTRTVTEPVPTKGA